MEAMKKGEDTTQQLVLFADPRDEVLQQALAEVEKEEWYQVRHGNILIHPVGAYTLEVHLARQGISVDWKECREWMIRSGYAAKWPHHPFFQ